LGVPTLPVFVCSNLTSEDYVLKYLPRVFTASSNPYGKTDTNKAFTTELEVDLRADKEYSEGWSWFDF